MVSTNKKLLFDIGNSLKEHRMNLYFNSINEIKWSTKLVLF